jgi:thiol-disulfide isomerase/thioredoxin
MILLCVLVAAQATPEMIPEDLFETLENESAAPGDIVLPMHDGSTFHLSGEKGHKVIVAFWASWCSPCRHELPALAKWAKTNPDVRIVAVNVDRNRADADRFLSSVHFDLPVGYDPDAKELGRYGVTSMPTMFLFDEKGALAWKHTGFSEERGFQELEEALHGKPKGAK